MKKFKDGDLLIAPNGLIGRLQTQEGTPECSVHSIDDNNWQVRAWSVAHLREAAGDRTPPRINILIAWLKTRAIGRETAISSPIRQLFAIVEINGSTTNDNISVTNV